MFNLSWGVFVSTHDCMYSQVCVCVSGQMAACTSMCARVCGVRACMRVCVLGVRVCVCVCVCVDVRVSRHVAARMPVCVCDCLKTWLHLCSCVCMLGACVRVCLVYVHMSRACISCAGGVNKIREILHHPSIVVTHTDAPELCVWNMDKQPNRTRSQVSITSHVKVRLRYS